MQHEESVDVQKMAQKLRARNCGELGAAVVAPPSPPFSVAPGAPSQSGKQSVAKLDPLRKGIKVDTEQLNTRSFLRIRP